MNLRALAIGFLALAGVASQPAGAQTLILGHAIGPTTMDPHHFAYPPNNEMAEHLYEALVGYARGAGVTPELATAWRVVDDRTWEFDLRPDVRFHDGTRFTSADVAYSIERARASTGPSPMSQYVRDIARVEPMGDLRLRIATREPFPLLLDYLARVHIVPAGLGRVAQADFDSGKAAIGTGPFRFERFAPGDTAVYARFEGYWGRKADNARVVFRVIANPSAREAALLAGDVHAISAPSPGTLDRLRADRNLEVVETSGTRVVYLGLQQARDEVAGLQGAGGRNPFKDVRVREAVSLAMDRQGLVDRILRGTGVPAAQLLYPGAFGFVEDLRPRPADVARARALLAQAGYPDGFQATLAVPNDLFANAVELANATASLLSRAGIRTTVDAQPSSVFRDRAGRGDFAAYVGEYGNPFPDGSAPLRAITGTRSRETGFGTQNFGGYANAEQNALLLSTFTMMDRDARRAALERAARMTFADHAVVPLYWNKIVVAKRRDAGRYAPRPDGILFAYDFRR